MSEQYGDLRVDRLTYTEAGANNTITVSGLVKQVQSGGTTSGNVTIEGNVTVTGTISGDTITGTTINITTANAESGVFQFLSGAVVTGNTAGFTTVTGATITGGTLNVTTGTFANGLDSNGTISGTTVTGSDVLFTNGTFQTLTGVATTGTSANYTFITGQNISGATGVFGTIEATNINFPATGISVATGVFDFLSGTVVTGDTAGFTTVTGGTITGGTLNVTTGTFAEGLTANGTISGTTVTGTSAEFTTGTFETIAGPIGSTTQTGVVRVATSAEAQSAVSPSGTYTDTISGDANSAFLINPSGLSSAFRSYDPPTANAASTGVYARVVVTTGIFPDQAIESVTWSGLDISTLAGGGEAVTDLQATSAVRPSGTYGVTASGTATGLTFYNPVQLEKTFKAYDPVATAAEEQLYARVVSGTAAGGGAFDTTSYGWIQVPTGTPTIATSAQAAAAAGATGTYSDTTTAANLPNIINPFHLRDAFKSYDPAFVSGQRRVYARVTSGVTSTSGNYEWLNITAAVDGSFLPLSGGTVTGFTRFTSGLGISGDVTQTGNFTQSGSHTTSGVNGFYNAIRASDAANVSYRINNAAGRGMFQSPSSGVGFSKGGAQIVEFSITGTDAFATISGDLRVGGNAQNVSNTNNSQFWAFSGGHFVAASTSESVVWKDATNANIFELKSNVGGQRSDVFGFGASGQLFVSGQAGTSGQLLASRGPGSGVQWADISITPGGDLTVHDLTVTGDASFASGMTVTGEISGAANSTITGFGQIAAATGEFLNIFALDEAAGGVRAFSGDFHDVRIGDPNIFGAFVNNPQLEVLGTGIFASGVRISGELSLSSGLIANNSAGDSGTFLMSQGTNRPVVWSPVKVTADGDLIVHDLTVTGSFTASSGAIISGTITGERFIATGETGLSISGAASGLFNSGIFITSNTETNPVAVYASKADSNSPNIVIGGPGLSAGNTNTNNLIIGVGALAKMNNARANNIAIGNLALNDLTDGATNTAIGVEAGKNIEPGGNFGGNVFLGYQAAMGENVGSNSTRDSVFIGNQAGLDVFQARDMVVIGREALKAHNSAGSGNIALGVDALFQITSGDTNTVIGHHAGKGLTGTSDNVTIVGAVTGLPDWNDTIAIGAGATQKVLISGDTFSLTRNDGTDAIIVTSGLTGDHTYELPNKSGIFAMTSDIPGGDSQLDVNNLSVLDDNDIQVARISGDQNGSAMFASGAVTIDNNGNLNTSGTLDVSGILTIASGLTASGQTGSDGQFLMSNGPGAPVTWQNIEMPDGGDLVLHDLTVTGTALFSSGMQVTGTITGQALSITGGGMNVSGDSTITGDLAIHNDAGVLVAAISGGDTAGSAMFASGNLIIDTDGNLNTSGTLGVSGIVTFASGLNCNGALGTAGDVLQSQGPNLPARWASAAGGATTGNIQPNTITVTGGLGTFNSGISVIGTGDFDTIEVRNESNVVVSYISGQGGNNGAASFASGDFTIANDGDTRISGTLNVSGVTTFTDQQSGIVVISGSATQTQVAIGTGDAGSATLAVVASNSGGNFASFSIGQNTDGSNEDHLGIWYGRGGTPQAEIFTATGDMNFYVDGAGGSGDIFRFGRGLGTESFVEISSGNLTVSGGTGATGAGEISLGENSASGVQTFTLKAPESLESGLTLIMPSVSPSAANRFLRATGDIVANTQQLEWASSPGGGISGVTIQDDGAQQGAADAITTFNFTGAGVTATVDGSVATIAIPSGGGTSSGVAAAGQRFARICDQKPAGTNGGNSAAGWNVRELNTEVSDVDSLVTVSGNGFRLQQGNYLVEWNAPAYYVNAHQSALSTSTSNADIIALGASAWAPTQAGTNSSQTASAGSFEVSVPQGGQTYYILHWMQTAQVLGAGFGVATNNGVPEIYAQVTITDLELSSGTGTVTKTNLFGANKVFGHVNWAGTVQTPTLASLGGVTGSRGIASVQRNAANDGILINFVPGTFLDENFTCTATAEFAIGGGAGSAYAAFETARTQDSITLTFSNGAALAAPIGFDIQICDNQPAEVALTTLGNVYNYNGVAAWFDGSGVAANGPATIDNSLNIASVTRIADGNYAVVFQNEMPNADYGVVGGGETGVIVGVAEDGTKTANGFTCTLRTAASPNTFNGAFSFAVNALNALPPEGTTGTDAWCSVRATGGQFDGYNATAARTGEGAYTITFGTPMPNSGYTVTVGMYDSQRTYRIVARRNEAFDIATFQADGTTANDAQFDVSVNATNARLPATITQEQVEALINTKFEGVTAWGDVAADGTLLNGMNVKVTPGTNENYVVFDTQMPNANYAVIIGCEDGSIAGAASCYSKTTAGFTYFTAKTTGGNTTNTNPNSFVVVSQNSSPPRGTTGADAWGYCDSTGTALASYNCTVSLVSDGRYAVTFNTPMPSANYAITASAGTTADGSRSTLTSPQNRTAQGFEVYTYNYDGQTNSSDFSFSVFATNANLPTTITQEQVEALARNPAVGAWGSVNDDASDFTGFNIDSVGRDGSQYVVDFINPMNNADYAVVGAGSVTSNNFYFEVNSARKTASGFTYWMVGPDTAGGTGNASASFQVIGATRNAAPLGGGADAWGNFTGSATVATENASFGVDSITRIGAGRYQVNLDPPMPNANYAVTACGAATVSVGVETGATASQFVLKMVGTQNADPFDAATCYFACFATDGNAGGYWSRQNGVVQTAKLADNVEIGGGDIVLKNNGEAEFDGTVLVGPNPLPTDGSPPEGLILYSTGGLVQNVPSTSDGLVYLMQSAAGNDRISFAANGNAVFAGNVTAANIALLTDALTQLKSTAAAATTLDELRGAIITALTSF